jgi:hypothetical protein
MNMTQIISKTDYFKSPDLPLIAALCCYDYCVESIDKSAPRKAIFYIKRDENLDQMIQRFFSRQLPVDPSTYFYALKNLKTMLYHS